MYVLNWMLRHDLAFLLLQRHGNARCQLKRFLYVAWKHLFQLTQVASRRVFQTAGLIMIVCGVIGKFGAVLTLIPEPIIGGTLTVVFGMVAAVGISTLKFIDMGSTRNLTILGLSLLLGLMVPQYINAKENANIINTGRFNRYGRAITKVV